MILQSWIKNIPFVEFGKVDFPNHILPFKLRPQADALLHQPIPHLGSGMELAHRDRVSRIPFMGMFCILDILVKKEIIKRLSFIVSTVCVFVNLSQLGSVCFSVVRSASAVLEFCLQGHPHRLLLWSFLYTCLSHLVTLSFGKATLWFSWSMWNHLSTQLMQEQLAKTQTLCVFGLIYPSSVFFFFRSSHSASGLFCLLLSLCLL